MKSIALKLFLILTAIASAKTLCNVQVTTSDLDTYTTVALELYALDHNLPVEAYLPHVTHLVFGRTEPGYVLFTKKLMRHACKTALPLVDSPIKFYSHVINEFNQYINNKTQIRILSGFTPKWDPAPLSSPTTQSLPKSFTILNTLITLSIITAILFLCESQTSLHQEIVNFHEQLSTCEEEVARTLHRLSLLQSHEMLPQRSGLSSLFS